MKVSFSTFFLIPGPFAILFGVMFGVGGGSAGATLRILLAGVAATVAGVLIVVLARATNRHAGAPDPGLIITARESMMVKVERVDTAELQPADVA